MGFNLACTSLGESLETSEDTFLAQKACSIATVSWTLSEAMAGAICWDSCGQIL